ncbi:MAG: response regulator [Pseudomonas stutzeri]|nr:response regulator [Stutzerimonas stutzeri]
MTTVLVVEDEHPHLFRQALEFIGYEVLVALRGDVAVELARQHRPAAIIMDLRLPGLNGIQAIRAIREFDVAVPIFAVTAYTDSYRREAAINAGANLYQAKPVDFTILLNQLEQAIGATIDRTTTSSDG